MCPPDDVSPTTPPVQDTDAGTAPLVPVVALNHPEITKCSIQARDWFTHAPTPMLLLTPTGDIADANLQAAHLLGVSIERLPGRRADQFVVPAAQTTLLTLLKAAFSQPGPHHAELRLARADGEARTVRLDVSQDLGNEEGLSLSHAVLQDITDLQVTITGLLDQVDMLQGQNQMLMARQSHLEREVQGVIRSTQAQLNVHLARVQNLLKRHVKAAGGSGDLTLAQQALTSTFGLLASLDGYVQARRLKLRPRPVNLDQVINDVRSELKSAMDGRVIDWTDSSLPTVYGDSRALRMILCAYLSNALKFTRPREVTRLRVHAEDHETEYHIGVEDNGIGFNNRLRDKAFELFGRLHPTGAYEGAGIDLATVRQLCERMGGRAWAEGKVDQGATFWFACPKDSGEQS
ncbi:ATP-binding protein [Deinococcus ficus]|uniref:ATP-binding protein n=1 Tax=Deinococcus ficus TaxID=317577 RepID=UPI000A07AF52|nr:ATP-binding protein [Deinococcus ficus]